MDALYQREQFWAAAKPNKKPAAGGVPNRNSAQPSKRTGSRINRAHSKWTVLLHDSPLLVTLRLRIGKSHLHLGGEVSAVVDAALVFPI